MSKGKVEGREAEEENFEENRRGKASVCMWPLTNVPWLLPYGGAGAIMHGAALSASPAKFTVSLVRLPASESVCGVS